MILERRATTGPGSRPTRKQHIFERFSRLDDARDRDAGGTGLGLAITHAVVTDHGGTITVENAPGARHRPSPSFSFDPAAGSHLPRRAERPLTPSAGLQPVGQRWTRGPQRRGQRCVAGAGIGAASAVDRSDRARPGVEHRAHHRARGRGRLPAQPYVLLVLAACGGYGVMVAAERRWAGLSGIGFVAGMIVCVHRDRRAATCDRRRLVVPRCTGA